jgi:hypothetical protein
MSIARLVLSSTLVLVGSAPFCPTLYAASLIPKDGEATVVAPSSAMPSAADLARAERLITSGYVAMQASNQDPGKSVDAAFAFTEALPIVTAAGDTERARELQANLFWCRKRMNHEALDRYLAGSGSVDKTVVAQIDAKVTAAVDPKEADAWMQAADLYAIEHPGEGLRIAIRYFEVAERFVGTKASLEAQRKSLDYQASSATATKQAKRETLFTQPAKVASGRQPVPDSKEVRSAVGQIRKDNKAAYADRTDGGRKKLMKELFELGQKTTDDALMRYALYEAALDLAVDLKHVDQMLTIVEAQADGYAIDVVPAKVEALGRLRSDSVAKAVITLLSDPADPAANTVAGRYFAFTVRRWDVGFAMLSIGDDEELVKVADMEIAKPQGSQQEVEMGDTWFALGGPKNSDTVAAWDRAMHWYEIASAHTEGATKLRIAARMDEMFGVVFPSKVDWNALSDEQWQKLRPIAAVSVAANAAKVDTRVTLREGQRARVIPAPGDQWTFNNPLANKPVETSSGGIDILGELGMRGPGGRAGPGARARGGAAAGGPAALDFALPLGSLIMYTDEAAKLPAGVIEGPGTITLRSAQPQFGSRGSIRVKILLLDE